MSDISCLKDIKDKTGKRETSEAFEDYPLHVSTFCEDASARFNLSHLDPYKQSNEFEDYKTAALKADNKFFSFKSGINHLEDKKQPSFRDSNS